MRSTASSRKYDIPLIFDVARWAENAYFIKMNEEGYRDKSIAEIATEMFSYCDGFCMSAKKDGHANMGGMVAFRDKGLFWQNFSDFNEDGTVKTDVGVLLKVKQISCYGNDSYGGMSGRDIMALAVGMYESCDFNYMHERVSQCEYLAQGFYKAGVKGVVLPAGGHAVYINMDEFFDGKRGHETFAGRGLLARADPPLRHPRFRAGRLFHGIRPQDPRAAGGGWRTSSVSPSTAAVSPRSTWTMSSPLSRRCMKTANPSPTCASFGATNLPMRHFHAFLEPYPNEEK